MTRYRSMVWVGMVLLAATASLHLALGLPPLDNAISAGFIRKAPGMSPEELKAIWIAFSVIFYVLLAGLAIAIRVGATFPLAFCLSVGFAALISAGTMTLVVGGFHPALPLLLVPAILMVWGAWGTQQQNK